MSYDSWLEAPYQTTTRNNGRSSQRVVCVELPIPTSNPNEWCPMDYFRCTVFFYDGNAEAFGECNGFGIELPADCLQALGEWFREECE